MFVAVSSACEACSKEVGFLAPGCVFLRSLSIAAAVLVAHVPTPIADLWMLLSTVYHPAKKDKPPDAGAGTLT
jgi:hypothetical protein